jgi:hypothetical protein
MHIHNVGREATLYITGPKLARARACSRKHLFSLKRGSITHALEQVMNTICTCTYLHSKGLMSFYDPRQPLRGHISLVPIATGSSTLLAHSSWR